jgi:hypothetical protein
MIVSGVLTGRQGADEGEMTTEQMIFRAEQAEHLKERFAELERERQDSGLYEEALEARRMRLEQEAAVLYWRDRADGRPSRQSM